MADPGFPVGGGRGPIRDGCGPLTRALFGKKQCKMKGLGPVGGVCPARPLDPPMISVTSDSSYPETNEFKSSLFHFICTT